MNVGEGSVNVQEVQVIENKDSRERCERFPPEGGGCWRFLLIGGEGGVGMFTTFAKFTWPPRASTNPEVSRSLRTQTLIFPAKHPLPIAKTTHTFREILKGDE